MKVKMIFDGNIFIAQVFANETLCLEKPWQGESKAELIELALDELV